MNKYHILPGRAMTVKHVRPGVFENTIFEDVPYRYDSPPIITYVLAIILISTGYVI
jgi:hypothetical protein